MKTLRLAFLCSVICPLASVNGQGSLTPLGSPGPTMKSLDQIEARKPIAGPAAVTISQSGSYYLTSDITVTTGSAITIAADNVTLDLNGFTLRSTASPASGFGIALGNARANVTILNGFITGGVTYSGGSFSGPGFQWGIAHSGNPARRVRVEGVTVTGCSLGGIYLNLQSTLIKSCVVETVGDTGLFASQVIDSSATTCGQNGVYADHAYNCTGYAVNNAYGVYAINASNCDGRSANGIGLYAVRAAQNCFGNCYVGSGVALSATTANNCVGVSVGGIGVQAATAVDCRGDSYGGNGVEATSAQNCLGTSSTSGNGIYCPFGTAENCKGTSSSGYGIGAETALNCRGQSSSGTAVFATNAQNCYGTSTGGTGVSATTAQNCYGLAGSGNGVYATTAQNCYGYSGSTAGVSGYIAIGCSGTGVPAVGSIHQYFCGSGPSPYP